MFTTLGRNSLVEARPAVVHFAGFIMGKTRTMKLRVVNISSTKQRIHVINPTTPFFIVRHNKLGDVAPGMAETLYIDFNPTEWRYYYDCIRLRTPDDSLLVPIHGYPVMYDSEDLFPKIIDFGVSAVGNTLKRVIPLRCSVPVDFEYEISIIEGHTAFFVSPLKGVVPANGQVQITVEFRPSSHLTCQSRIQLNISQFDFKPIDCLLVGSAAAVAQTKRKAETTKTRPKSAQSGYGKEMDGVAMTLTAQLPASRFPSAPGTTEDSSTDEDMLVQQESGLEQSLVKLATLSLNQGKGRNTATADAVEAILRAEKNSKKSRSRRAMKKVDGRSETPDKGVEIDGYRMPPASELNNIRAVSDVLMQQPGKMRIKELKKAIAERKTLQKARQKEAEREEIEDLDMTARRQVKELTFEQQLRKVEKFERNKDMKWFECLGEDLATTEELEGIRENRIALEAQVRQQMEAEECNRSRSILESSSSRPLRPRDYLPPTLPTFSDLKNSSPWIARGSVLDLFRRSACKVIARGRATKRLRMIGQFLNAVNRDKDAIQSVVFQQAAEQALVAAGAVGSGVAVSSGETASGDSGDRVQVAPPDACDDASLADFDMTKLLASSAPESIIMSRFPLYREHDFRENVRVDVPELIDFEDWNPIPLKVPRHFKSMNYPTTISTAPPEARKPGDAQARTMREGAQVEFCTPGIRDSPQAVVQCPPLPADIDTILDPAPASIFAPVPLPLPVSLGGLPEQRETAIGRDLHISKKDPNAPRAPPPAAKFEPVGIGSIMSMEGRPTFSEVHRGQSEDFHSQLKQKEKEMAKRMGIPDIMVKPRDDDLKQAEDLDAEESGVVSGIVKDFSGITPRTVPLSEMCPEPNMNLAEKEFDFSREDKRYEFGDRTSREIAFRKMGRK